jgi:hypothetical protein
MLQIKGEGDHAGTNEEAQQVTQARLRSGGHDRETIYEEGVSVERLILANTDKGFGGPDAPNGAERLRDGSKPSNNRDQL